jgi:hypothetical protein
MKPSPMLFASFWKSVRPFFFSSFEMAEYRDEFIDLEVGIIKGGIFVAFAFSFFSFSRWGFDD